MREIKFRFWDEEDARQGKQGMCNEMFSEYEGEGLNQMFQELHKLGIVVEQFTGLHDKNGTEIYEGDIITNGFERKTVERCNGGWNPFIDMMETDDAWHWEIIGNIHENPELLEEARK